MEVRPGYHLTEAGIVPRDWGWKRIAELNPFVTSGSRGWAERYSEYGTPFIRITNLSRSNIYLDLDDLRRVVLPANDAEAVRTELRDGDVLISVTADIGIIGYVSPKLSKPAHINQHIALVRFDASATNSKFISYFLASGRPQRLFRALTDSGAKAGMNLSTVQKIPICLPPTRAEQDAIAEALSDADGLVESLEQLLAKKRQIRQGAMQELLTGKKRLPGFEISPGIKETEIGLIPRDWEIRSIGDISDVGRGRVISHREIARSFSPRYPVYSSQTSNNGVMGYLDGFEFEGEYLTWTTDGANEEPCSIAMVDSTAPTFVAQSSWDLTVIRLWRRFLHASPLAMSQGTLVTPSL